MSEYGRMLKEVQSLDFALYEAALFLDTHCNDVKALKYFNHYQMLADEARKKFESRYGSLTHRSDGARDRWDWIDSPWPWDYDCGNEMRRD